MRVSVLALNNCTPIAYIGAMELFRKAGVIHQELNQQEKPFFQVDLVTVGQRINDDYGFSITGHHTLDELQKTDLLLIPAIDFDINQKLEQNKEVVPHLLRLKESGAILGSICTGAFLLASTGLLDGRNATTHWAMAEIFKQMFPKVILLPNQIIVDNNDICTCGGATSFMNLVVYLVEKYCGFETAIMVSNMLLIDINKPNQSTYSIFTPQMQHGDDLILEAQKCIHAANTLIPVEELAEKYNVSYSTFYKRFKKATGESPINYIQKNQVETVKHLLQTTSKTVGEVMYEVGYNDMSHFRKIFKKHTGLNPKEYRSKFFIVGN